MRIEQHGWLQVRIERADFDPAILTKRLGVEPTDAWRLDEPKELPGGRGTVRRWTSLWAYDTGELPTRESHDLVNILIDLFADHATILADFAREVGAELTVGVCAHNWGDIDEEDDSLLMDAPFVNLDTRAIAFLAATGADFTFDQWLYREGHDGLGGDAARPPN